MDGPQLQLAAEIGAGGERPPFSVARASALNPLVLAQYPGTPALPNPPPPNPSAGLVVVVIILRPPFLSLPIVASMMSHAGGSSVCVCVCVIWSSDLG